MSSRRTASLITLGCARNEVDSEELAARLEAAGWQVGDGGPDVIVVNTCGFIDSAKKDSIDTLLAAADSGAKVVAAGCMAERYGDQLADALPEATAVISFDDYATDRQASRRRAGGHTLVPHIPATAGPCCPSPRSSAAAAPKVNIPGHGELPEGVAPASGPRPLRKRLGDGPVASLKLASGCDRRCTFCAIPAFRGAYVSRNPSELLGEAAWLGEQGVKRARAGQRELHLLRQGPR